MKLSQKLRFVSGPLPNTPWGDLLRRFKYIEDLGFDVTGTGDHFVDWSNPQGPWFEHWTLLAAVAASTSRIRILSGVTQIPFRNPALLAKQALTVDHISNGRLELGLGAGILIDPAYEMMGIPNWEPRERVARFKEYVEIVDQLLSNNLTTYSGRYYKVKEAAMNPRPIQKPRPPITIAAWKPHMMRYAARYADNWNTISSAATFEEQLDEVRSRNQLVDEYCQEIEREPSSLRRSVMLSDSKARARGGLINYYDSMDLFLEMVEKFVEVGITEFVIYYPYREEQLPMFERIAREAIPALKERYE